MGREYVDMRNNGYYISGSRISLDSIVYLYRDGSSAEVIQDDFPFLSLEQIHGAIAFYLANKQAVDKNVFEGEHEFNCRVPSLESRNPELYARLQRARQELNR